MSIEEASKQPYRPRGTMYGVLLNSNDEFAGMPAQVTRCHFDQILTKNDMGITLQLDEGAPAYDDKHSSIHPLF